MLGATRRRQGRHQGARPGSLPPRRAGSGSAAARRSASRGASTRQAARITDMAAQPAHLLETFWRAWLWSWTACPHVWPVCMPLPASWVHRFAVPAGSCVVWGDCRQYSLCDLHCGHACADRPRLRSLVVPHLHLPQIRQRCVLGVTGTSCPTPPHPALPCHARFMPNSSNCRCDPARRLESARLTLWSTPFGRWWSPGAASLYGASGCTTLTFSSNSKMPWSLRSGTPASLCSGAFRHACVGGGAKGGRPWVCRSAGPGSA